jgi:hypothetical protein
MSSASPPGSVRDNGFGILMGGRRSRGVPPGILRMTCICPPETRSSTARDIDGAPGSFPHLGMVYRKGELSPARIDRGWPHQVALPAAVLLNGGYNAVHAFCDDLSLCPRGHAVFHDGQWSVHCFADAEHAEKFMRRFGGEWFDPRLRGKGSNWARWKK